MVKLGAPAALLAILLSQGAPPPAREVGSAAQAGPHPALTTPGDAGCVACHGQIVKRKVPHGPVAAGACSPCHEASQQEGVSRIRLVGGATPANVTALCVACHEDIAARLKLPHVHAPVAAGTCTTCHDPHGSDFRYQLPGEGPQVCLGCHQDIADLLQEPRTHAPARTACVVCHDPHGTPHRAQAREALNGLCLACHLEAPTANVAEDADKLFERIVSPAERGLTAGAPRIRLDASLRIGHPMAGHPVGGVRDPMEPQRTMTCVSCHNPHGARGGRLLRFGALGVSGLCVKCHKY